MNIEDEKEEEWIRVYEEISGSVLVTSITFILMYALVLWLHHKISWF